MKKLVKIGIAMAIALCVATSVEAKDVKEAKEVKAKKEMVTSSFRTDIHCESCVAKVMNVLPYQKGVKDVKIDLASKNITVLYDGEKNNEEALVQSLAKLDVNVVKDCTTASCCSDR